MPSQFEEVLVQAHPFGPQNSRPDRRHLLLQRGDRRSPILLFHAGIWLGQRLAIQLAVGVERHAVEEDQVRRHHVVRQVVAQGGHQLFAHLGALGFRQRLRRHQVGQQLVVGSQQQRFTHAVLGQQHGFDLTQFYAKATDLDLVIDPPDIFHHTIGAITRQVAGAVQALAGWAERISDKALGGQAWPLQIRTGQAIGAGDIEFTHGAQR